ncbi:hypothetical protein CA13_64190 [Planctomycetes bacterium CA13]|uniref:Uncharacterized protein n=1 Tax=Novipirellula herctigrandis TaxID=2527986 RepID=A0A5C5ZCQ4_9BACT|nr:hypothetical protein CA13_64190 [Planctomycetes bacterium CA13]
MRQQDTESTEYSGFCDYRDAILAELPAKSDVLKESLLVSDGELDAALARLPEDRRHIWQNRFDTGYACVADSQRTQLAVALCGNQFLNVSQRAA